MVVGDMVLAVRMAGPSDSDTGRLPVAASAAHGGAGAVPMPVGRTLSRLWMISLVWVLLLLLVPNPFDWTDLLLLLSLF